MVQIGMILEGKYEILEHIGSGGMADVFKAKYCHSDQYVAVKVLRREYCEDEAMVRRFTTEARSMAGLHHPNVVGIIDEGFEQGIHYIIMELAEGMTLKRYIRRYGRLSVRETVDFAIQIASGIQAAHAHHIVHRDIKPQNIIVSDSGNLKVTDFGIAKAATGDTIASSTMGSVRYLSPEQARGGYSDSRTDIYSLGITIYEMATGKVPFDGENTVAIAMMHLKDEMIPPRNYFPDIPVSLENIILKCTRKRPEERYQTAGELIQDLQKVFLAPDGNYVYVNPQVDDSPTMARSRDEIEEIKHSLTEIGAEKSGVRSQEQKREPEEDEEDDRSMNPKLEKLILFVAVAFGILLACLVFYVVGTSTYLLRISNKTTTEKTTAGQTAEKTDGKTEETTGRTEATTGGGEVTTEKDTVYVTLPSFLGMSKEAAEKKVRELSLKVQFLYEEESGETEHMTVVKQQYEKGESLPEGSVIALTLGEKEDPEKKRVDVPGLVNYTEEKAKEELDRLGLKAKIVYANSDTVPEGYVIRQTPKGGSVVDEGFAITITVSRGVVKVKVPSLYGLTQEAAERELNRVGLVLGKVSSNYSGSVGVGDVIEQGIPSGESVDKGTEVSIVISLGEQETYHYEGSVNVIDSPLEEEETGVIELVLVQGNSRKTIYSEKNATSDSFPLEVSFESSSGRDAEVQFFVNGQEYNSYPVDWNAVAD